jgi:hypothetical protein
MGFTSDKHQFGVLLMITGFCSLNQSLFSHPVARRYRHETGRAGTTADSAISLPGLIGGLCLVNIGIVSVNQAVHDWDRILGPLQSNCLHTPHHRHGQRRTEHPQRVGVGFIPNCRFQSVLAPGHIGNPCLRLCLCRCNHVHAVFVVQTVCLPGKHTSRQKFDHSCCRMSFSRRLHRHAVPAGLSQLMLGAYIISNFGGARIGL